MPEQHNFLIFVYRAERGIFNTISHSMHRVFSPATYECRLCQFTSSAFGMLKLWKTYLESRPETKLFYHRKEFEATWPDIGEEPPLILESFSPLEQPRVLLGRHDIESCRNPQDLIQKLDRALEHSGMDRMSKP